MSFLSKLDPNVVMTWGGIFLSGLAWLYHKAKGDKTASARDILDSLVVQVINAPGVNLDNVKDRVELAARTALKKMGLKGAIVETLVHEFVEYGSAELHKRYDLIDKQLQEMVKKTIDVTGAFTPPTTSTVPTLNITVEPIT